MKNRKFGKYEVLQRLGRGGMAEVYRAYHPNLDRYVAIKVLHSFLSDDQEFKVRFEREAQNIARLRHPNIVQVYDFDYDVDSDSPYIVMELIEGSTLKDYLVDLPEGVRRLPLEEVIRVMRQSAEALSYAHQRGMIHRDVKPANLMIDSKENNRIVLTDFGIAKLLTGNQATLSGGLVGTPAYMSPEQGAGEVGDERSDLYSLGVILYQMLTGNLPYDAETPMALILQHMNDPIPSVRTIDRHLPPAVDKILMRLMAKSPADRYQTAQDFINDLDLLETAPARLDPTTLVLPKPVNIPQKPKTIPRQAETSERRLPLAMMMLIIGFIILGGGLYVVGVNNGLFPRLPFMVAFLGTETPTFTATPIDTSTYTPTATLTVTLTPSQTASSTLTATRSASATASATVTANATPTATLTASSSPSPTKQPSPTLTPSVTLSPSATFTITPTIFSTRTATVDVTLTAAFERTATTTACNFDYGIIEQNPEDGAEGGFFHVNAQYCRKIKLLNTGTCAWERNTSLTFIPGSGENFNAGARIFITEAVEPGAEITLNFEGTLPARGSTDPINGRWELRTAGQIPIGEPFDISVMVFDPGSNYTERYECPASEQ